MTRQHAPAARQRRQVDADGYLYVIEIGDDRIKVGYTVSPKARLAEHRGMALAHGCTPGREWVSMEGTGNRVRERTLIAWCVERATAQLRTEYFTGIAFLDAVGQAAELCGDPVAARRFREREAAERAEQERIQREARLAAFELALPEPVNGLSQLAGSVSDAAQWLGTSEAIVEALIASGDLPHFKVKRLVRISVSALRRLVAARDHTSLTA